MTNQPLARRMRPKTMKDIAGQKHLLGSGEILDRMITSQQISSIILYGPPGTGKTSIAHALSNDLDIPFKYVNASVHGKKELQNATIGVSSLNPAVLLIDEVHRLTRPNQDYLLMYIEEGSIILVGATTENPYMSIVPALRSRSGIFELKSLEVKDIVEVLKRSLKKENGLGNYNIELEDSILEYIASQVNGDVRTALNTLELAVTSEVNEDPIKVTKDVVNTCLQARQIGGDKNGDTHYNLLSAFQKSIRGSDVDASLHYLARLLEGGDLISVLRRVLVIAYEDIGLADPSVPMETLAAVQSAERMGLPEAKMPLSFIVTRLALSPKSNVAYKGYENAKEEIEGYKDLSIPESLQDTHYKGAKQLGKGIGYQYSHDFPHGLARQQYLPDDFSRDRYLEFRDDTDTKFVRERYTKINNIIKD